MNPREQGFLLLTSHLGNPERKVMTVAQLRRLALRVRDMKRPEGDEPIREEDLIDLGYDREEAGKILSLFSEEDILAWYLSKGAKKDCVPVTRVSPMYPQRLRNTLGIDCPGSLWAKGDLSLLSKPAIALVGSRELRADNLLFAKEAGKQAALQGYVLVSGNARGADKTAQDACLEAGGQVISVVADDLRRHEAGENILFLSEESYDQEFSSQRALSRNRVIHSLGEKTLVAQCTLEAGGTWDGTVKNLKALWSPVYAFWDGSRAAQQLVQMGAQPVKTEDLTDMSQWIQNNISIFDQ